MNDMRNNQVRLIQELKEEGLDFNQDVFELSLDWKSKLAEYAKEFHYRKPTNSYVGLGGAFYLHLQKLARKL